MFCYNAYYFKLLCYKLKKEILLSGELNFEILRFLRSPTGRILMGLHFYLGNFLGMVLVYCKSLYVS